jgi:AcrR family transcriptional regulator
MARRPGPSLSRDDVIRAAFRVVERDGPDHLGIRQVADELGIQSSSIYHHVDGLERLREATAIAGWARLVASFPDPVESPAGTLRSLAEAYRGFVRANPGLYRLMTAVPFQPNDAALLVLASRMGEIVVHLGLPPEDTIHAIRGLRAAVHGFVDLENAGQFKMAVSSDASFEWMLDVIVRGLGGR